MSDPIQQHYVKRSHDAAHPFRFLPKYAADGVLMALPAALGIVFIEITLASQGEHWLGGTREQWLQTLATLAVYWSMIGIAAVLLAAMIRLVTRHEWIDRHVVPVTVLLSGAGLWSGLRAFTQSDFNIAFDLAYLLGLIVVAVATVLFGVLRIAPRRWFAIQTAATLLGAIAVTRYASILYALEDARTVLAPVHGVIWLGVLAIAIVFANVMFMSVRAPVRVSIGIIATASMLPFAFYAAPRLWASPAPTGASNFLLISADTMRADQSSVYGGPVSTPALEALAAKGVVADRFYTTAPWTVPSLCSLFSGRFPVSLTPGLPADQLTAEETSQHRLYAYWRGASGPTLVSGMRAKGYKTIAVVANPATNAHHWLWQDFDRYQLVDGAASETYGPFSQSPLFRDVAAQWFDGLIEARPIDSTKYVVHYAQTILNAHAHEPFFLWVHFMDPHSPYDPPPTLRVSHERWSMFPPTTEEEQAEPDWPYTMTDTDKQFALDQYRAEIAYVDSAVGSILGGLGAKSDSIYVCFFSDHGEEFWEHDRWGHGQTLFDEQLRVPFIIKGPRLAPGRIETTLSAIDFAPTVADLLDTLENPGWHGQSFAAALRDPAAPPPPRPVFAQATQHLMYQEEPQQMVLDNMLKFVRGLDSGSEQLFNLEDDPAETKNLSEDRSEEVTRLRSLLDTWQHSFPSTFEEALGGGAVEADPETMQRMKDIGYLQD